MERKRKRADKAIVPKICFERVKAFVDTDAGFVPTTSKMDLLTGHAFTSLLKNLGTRGNMPEDVTLEIFRETRRLKLQDVEKEYQEWIREMHEFFDEEVECEDQPHSIVPGHLKELGFSQEVYRVYSHMNRKGSLWKQGTRLKFYKGLPGHKKDFYATLEYFLADGLSEDKGNTKVICRPMDIAKAEGSSLIFEEESSRFEMGKSVAVPIEFLTLDKCEILQDNEWKRICDNKHLHSAGEIEILDKKTIQGLGLDGGITTVVKAGVKPFHYIYAVVRPNIYMKSIKEGKEMNPIDQRSIVKKAMQMKLQLRNLDSSEKGDEENFETDISMLVNEKSINNIQGFYCFGIENGDFRRFYTKAGKYTLTLSVMDEGNSEGMLEKTLVVNVLPSDKVGKWILQNVEGSGIPVCRLGSEIGPLLLQCLDEYGNVKNVDVTEDSRFEVWSGERKLEIDLSVRDISRQEKSRTSLLIEAIKLTGGLLRGIAMDYAALLKLVVSNKPVASMELNVLPGEMASIQVVSIDDIDNCLQTGDVIHLFTLQVMDGSGNPVEKGRKVVLQLDNVELQDSQGLDRMVDDKGCICLGGLLKVTGPFNSRATICVYSENQKLMYKKEFFLLKRTLQIVSTIPKNCVAGGSLCDTTVQIVDENGNVDKTMTGGQHFVHVEQHLYPMKEGTCCIKEIQLPDQPGPWYCHINHMMSRELEAQIEINLVPCEYSSDMPDTPAGNDKSPKLLHDKTRVQKDLKRLGQSLIAHLEDLKKKMGIYLNKLKKAEDELDKLNDHKKAKLDRISVIEGEIESLQIQAENIQQGSMIGGQDKNDISAERIAQEISKTSFPAKFFLEAFCSGSFLSAEAGNPLIADILGVVCLLASTKDAALSQALAEFIGLENMIAVVCKTNEAASLLIRLNKVDHTIDETWGLYKLMRNQNRNIQGKLRMFILEDMRCYCKEQDESHPQKLLNIEEPRLENGTVPNGFKGYAVNLLHLNEEHLDFRVACEDHGGLRGSLFYSLLKELQVYDTRKNLFSARDVLTTGGISLDGGLIRERGCEDFGTREQAKIIFPLYSKDCEEIPNMRFINHISQSMQVEDDLKAQKQELQQCKAQLRELEDRMKFVKKQVKAREEKCLVVSDEMERQKEDVAQLQDNLRNL